MTETPPRILTLFLSNGGSLTRWREQGILSREILLYRKFVEDQIFGRIQIFSYDPADEALVASENLIGMEVIAPRNRAAGTASKIVWSLNGVLRNRRRLGRSAWFKTNQISGSWAAILARLLTGKPLMMRSGYILSRRFQLNGQPARAWLARRLEQIGFAVADRIVVTSEAAAAVLGQDPRYKDKTYHVPTYVDVARFAPKTSYDFSEPLLYVGRLEPQKNVLELISACRRVGVDIDLVGTGSLQGEIEQRASQPGSKVRMLGQIANEELANLMRTYSVYALTSFHEGLPKTLIEAMACGLVCIGSDIPGTHDLIRDGETGYLVTGFDADAIAEVVRRAMAERSAALGKAARRLVVERFSLERYVATEAELYAAPIVR